MLAAALRLALRRLARRPGTTALHVGGLAVGLACCFLAVLYVRDEGSYDRFHTAADRIFQLSEERSFGDNTVQMLSTTGSGIDALRTGVPAVEAVTVTEGGNSAASVRRPGGTALELDDVTFADSAFFRVFSFPLLSGDARTALSLPGRAVLTATTAARLFGPTDPIGQTLLVERTGFRGTAAGEPLELEVSGVAADPPANSSVTFSALISGTTPVRGYDGTLSPALADGGASYVLLQTAADTTAVQAVLEGLATGPEADRGSFGSFARIGTTPLTALHTTYHTGGMVGKPLYLVLFSAVALLILLLACINYANLATALALRRGTEVGVRKAVGAGRGQLTRQFLAEALLLAGAAGAVAAGLVSLVLPAFNHFFGKGIGLDAVDPTLVAAMAGLTVFAGLMAGAYPAFVLSGFRPAAVLKGQTSGGRSGRLLRQSLVVVQFTVTAVLLAGTAVVWGQLRYARTADLGFRGDQAVVLDLDAPGLAAQREALREELAPLPGVRHVSLASGVPGDVGMIFSLSPETTPNDPSDDVQTNFSEADAAYAGALGLRLAAGRWLSPDETGATDEDPDFGGPIILNETAARALGLMTTNAQAAVGQRINHFEVVGVVHDFNFDGLRAEIGPFAFIPLGEHPARTRLVLQLDQADLPGTLAAVQAAWLDTVPTYPFASRFVDERFAEQMAEDRQLGQLFGVFGGVAVLLACLGMVGLAAHAAERRTKEIGVRKVLGATAARLVALLSVEFVRLVAVALVIAAPITVVLARRWLEDFVFRAPISPLPFAAIALGILALAVLAVSAHAIRAATADPVKTLRSE